MDLSAIFLFIYLSDVVVDGDFQGIFIVVVIFVVFLGWGGCRGVGDVDGGGDVGDGASRDESVDCNQANAIAKSLKHACIWFDAILFQLFTYCGSYYGIKDYVGCDGVHD